MHKSEDKSDATLLAEIQQGKHQAFNILVLRHYQRCYRIAWRIVFNRSDAEDIVQETFLKIWQRPYIWSAERNCRFSTWVYRVVLNAGIDFNRKKKTRAAVSRLFILNQAEATDITANHSPIVEYLQKLSSVQQQVINLFYYEELSTVQTAEILKLSPKAVEAHLRRARQRLSALIPKETQNV